MLRIFPEIFKEFSCLASWETETTENSLTRKRCRFFNAKPPGKLKEKFTKALWRAGKVTDSVQIACIVKRRGSESSLFWGGGGEFLRNACSLGIPVRDPLVLIKPPTSTVRLVKPLVFTMPLVCRLLIKGRRELRRMSEDPNEDPKPPLSRLSFPATGPPDPGTDF